MFICLYDRCREDWLAQTLCELNQERQRPFPEAKKRFLELRAVKEIVDFFKEPKSDKKGIVPSPKIMVAQIFVYINYSSPPVGGGIFRIGPLYDSCGS